MRKSLLLLAIIIISTTLAAKMPGDSLTKKVKLPDSLQVLLQEQLRKMDSIESTLHYKTGKIELGNGIASINVPEGFKFLEAKEAQYVVEDLWGNPKSEAPLGLLMPANSGATDPGGYAYIVKFESIGYVKDKDADKINYDDLLKDMKKGSEEDNVERRKMGYTEMHLIGWAKKPFYDKERKVLHWAKEFSVPETEENTLNYDIRVLGRKGILTLQAVSGMSQLDSVNKHVDDVLGMVTFNDGNKYSDFNSKTDEVAAWTIGGLVAGKILAKVGFFALILKNIKLIGLGLVAAGSAIWRFITGRRRKKEELVYESPSTSDTPPESNPQ